MSIYLYVTGADLDSIQEDVTSRLESFVRSHSSPFAVVNQQDEEDGSHRDLGLISSNFLDKQQDRSVFVAAVMEMKNVSIEYDCEIAVGIVQGQLADDIDYIDQDTNGPKFAQDFLRALNGQP